MSIRKKENGQEKEKVEDLLVGGEELKREKEKEIVIDGQGKYMVVNPRRLYLGKSYADWTTDWFNWFLSADADERNSGPVVFLRSHGLPNKITGAFTSDIPGQAGTDTLPDSRSADMDYRANYLNDPNIRIGSDRLQIFEYQAVFVPIIIAYEFASIHPYIDWGWMQDSTGLTIDYGDNPPQTSQLTINNKEIKLGLEMDNFRIATPIFTAVVPETQYGRSIKDFLEDTPILPGSYPALVEGYFVMLKFWPGSYWVHSWASAPRERSGPYFSELLYQIEVGERAKGPHKGLITEGRPSRNDYVFNQTLSKKKEIGELTEPEIKRFRRFLRPGSSPSPP
jgi:hypothetical protein